MRTQQLSLFIQLQRCSSYQASLYLRLITSKKFHSSTSVMYSNFNDDYMYSGTSSRPSTFRGHWNRGQPAYEEPESYDTSRFMRNEDKPLSPRRPNYSQRSPLWRNTPSPPPTPLPLGPSPEYISISEEELRPVDPSEQRKLLILDLNGALLWRKDRRVPYPRPYMPSFRAYLFAEETRKWLDVMVWSSAQPHNVDMMVRRCFYDSRCGYNPEEANPEAGKWEGLLVDVWARDRLGLSRHDYSRKSQTTKDLSKPWTLLQAPQQHSAYTTLLLDDSPAKVRLQPYNHLCVPEYDEKRRNRDLQVKAKKILETIDDGICGQSTDGVTSVNDAAISVNLPADSIISSDAPAPTLKDSIDSCAEDSSATHTSEPSPVGNESNSEPVSKTREEKRKEKKERKKQESVLRKLEELASTKVSETMGSDEKVVSTNTLLPVVTDGETENLRSKERSSEVDWDEDRRLDETLLAAIGILDEMKTQGNVAAWIKSGGLWAGTPSAALSHIQSSGLSSLSSGDVKRAPSPTDAEVDDLDPHVLGDSTAAAASSMSSTPPPTSPNPALDNSSSRPTSPEHSSPDRKRYRSVTADTHSAHEGESDLKKSKTDQAKDDTISAGNDAETIGSKSPNRAKSPGQTTNEVSTDRGEPRGDSTGTDNTVPKMWFEDESTFRLWVNRGRAALKSLGIEERDGIEVL